MPVQITARRDGFRRLGIAHSEKTTTWPDSRFTANELDVLKNDPNLIVVVVSDAQASGQPDTAELDKAKTRITELEAAVTQLSTDGDSLKKQLDEANATIASLQATQPATEAPVKEAAADQAPAADEPAAKKKG